MRNKSKSMPKKAKKVDDPKSGAPATAQPPATEAPPKSSFKQRLFEMTKISALPAAIAAEAKVADAKAKTSHVTSIKAPMGMTKATGFTSTPLSKKRHIPWRAVQASAAPVLALALIVVLVIGGTPQRQDSGTVASIRYVEPETIVKTQPVKWPSRDMKETTKTPPTTVSKSQSKENAVNKVILKRRPIDVRQKPASKLQRAQAQKIKKVPTQAIQKNRATKRPAKQFASIDSQRF